MVSTTNVNDATISSSGKRSQTVLTVCQLVSLFLGIFIISKLLTITLYIVVIIHFDRLFARLLCTSILSEYYYNTVNILCIYLLPQELI